MNADDLPDYTMPFLTGSWNPLEAVAMGEFTGPNWSDGKRQGSVFKTSKKPTSKIDVLSKGHDGSYATCDSLDCLSDADWAYYERSRNLSLFPRIIGALPLLGNAPGRFVSKALGHSYKGAHYGENMSQAIPLSRLPDGPPVLPPGATMLPGGKARVDDFLNFYKNRMTSGQTPTTITSLPGIPSQVVYDPYSKSCKKDVVYLPQLEKSARAPEQASGQYISSAFRLFSKQRPMTRRRRSPKVYIA